MPGEAACGGIFTYHDGNMDMISYFYFGICNMIETNFLILSNVIIDKAKVSVPKSNIVIEKLIVQLTALLILVHSIRD